MNFQENQKKNPIHLTGKNLSDIQIFTLVSVKFSMWDMYFDGMFFHMGSCFTTRLSNPSNIDNADAKFRTSKHMCATEMNFWITPAWNLFKSIRVDSWCSEVPWMKWTGFRSISFKALFHKISSVISFTQ